MNPPILTIRLFGDPVLRKKALPIKDIGPPERMLIESMIATMYEAKGVGLAGPQVGISQRLFVADIGEGPMVFINPRIVKRSGMGELEEGCLSIPGINIKIKRAQKIVVKYKDQEGKVHERIYEDLLARVISHEIDHLNGRMIVDYVKFGERMKLKKELKELMKEWNSEEK